MMPLPFGRRAPATRDRLLLLRDGQAQLLPVDSTTAAAVGAGSLSLPRDSLVEFVFRDGGRLFLGQADLPALVEAERVRALEESAVLRAVMGGPEERPVPSTTIWTWMQLGLTAFVLIKVMGHHG